MTEIILAMLVLIMVAIGFLYWRLWRLAENNANGMEQLLEGKHRAMLTDLHEGLGRQGDRIASQLADSSERLRTSVAEELRLTREALTALQVSQSDSLSQTREAMLRQLAELSAKVQQTLAEQGRADQELIQATMRHTTEQLSGRIEAMTRTADERLAEISGKVAERLDEGFKKTNETFANVMARLATIDEAQKKIDGLTSNVVSLQELLGDKRSRGAFGEVQLESLVRNILPPQAYEMQMTLPNGSRVDCVLRLPEPTGLVAVDSKFPMENYHRMFEPGLSEPDRLAAQKQFRADIRKHVDDIAGKYIIANCTSDGAVMFVPAEAVFAEIHAYHPEVVDYAMQRRVWIVSPTTLMAVLNTARAVMKDVETRKQVHIIKDELSKLGKDFARFDERMKKLADHIRQAHEDAEQVHISSKKISKRFNQIEAVELDNPREGGALLESGAEDET